MSVTAQMVKELREKTGAGMMDSKKALQETGGDMEAAADWLRAKGLAKAAKKAGRTAADGLIGVVSDGRRAAMVEVNAETDFVARNEQFQALVRDIAEAALRTDGSVTAVKAASLNGRSVDDAVKEAVATIGEHMEVRRAAMLEVDQGVVSSYVHNATVPNLGKIGVLVALRSSGDRAQLETVGRQLAMHIAFSRPSAIDVDGLDPAEVERERAFLADQARESGKPENIIGKMVEGRLQKYYEEVVLLKQTYVIDGDRTVETALSDAGKDVGAPIELADFACFVLGDDVAREETDFAAEVAAAVSGA